MTRLLRWRLVAAMTCVLLVFTSCGDDAEEFSASCSISRSELGPFGSNQAIGEALSAEEAQARAEATGFEGWIQIDATGTWDEGWSLATQVLGQGIHTQLAWFDVEGTITDLYTTGDEYEFEDLRVSRSFQGKIEHSNQSLFIGIDPSQANVNFDAGCEVAAVLVGDEQDDARLDIIKAAAFPPDS